MDVKEFAQLIGKKIAKITIEVNGTGATLKDITTEDGVVLKVKGE